MTERKRDRDKKKEGMNDINKKICKKRKNEKKKKRKNESEKRAKKDIRISE